MQFYCSLLPNHSIWLFARQEMKTTFKFNQKETVLKKNVTHSEERSPCVLSFKSLHVRKQTGVYSFSVWNSGFKTSLGLVTVPWLSDAINFPFQEWASHIPSPQHSGFCFALFSFSYTLQNLSVSSKTQDSVKVPYDLCSSPDHPCFLLSRATMKRPKHMEKDVQPQLWI